MITKFVSSHPLIYINKFSQCLYLTNKWKNKNKIDVESNFIISINNILPCIHALIEIKNHLTD